MTGDVVYLLFLIVVMGGWAARDAFLDRTPRKPFSWRRPELEWWAIRRSHREHRHAVDFVPGRKSHAKRGQP